jgi:hypothetical protein
MVAFHACGRPGGRAANEWILSHELGGFKCGKLPAAGATGRRIGPTGQAPRGRGFRVRGGYLGGDGDDRRPQTGGAFPRDGELAPPAPYAQGSHHKDARACGNRQGDGGRAMPGAVTDLAF